MRKGLIAFALVLMGGLALASCSNGGTEEDEGDGQIVSHGGEIADFSGHKNSLDWFIGTFLEDGGSDYPYNDTWTVANTSISIKQSDGVINYKIKAIDYNSSPMLVGSYYAPAGTWTFSLEIDDGFESEYKVVIEKVNKNSFYPTFSTSPQKGTITRSRVR